MTGNYSPHASVCTYLDALLAGVFAPLAGALRRLVEALADADFLFRADARDGPAEEEAGEVALEDDFDEPAGVADRGPASPLFSVMYFGFWTLGVDRVLLAERLLLKMTTLVGDLIRS